MTSSWDNSYIASPSRQRYHTYLTSPLTSVAPPETRKVRVGPSGYEYVSQAPAFEGQMIVVIPPQSTVPNFMVVVRIGGTLVWKQVLMGSIQSRNQDGEYDPFANNKKGKS